MKPLIVLSLVVTLVSTSCVRNRQEVWEDTKTCGRYFEKGFRSLLGKHSANSDTAYLCEGEGGETSRFFVLTDDECYDSCDLEDLGTPDEIECAFSPGDPESSIPGIEGFYTPDGELTSIFVPLHFPTDKYDIQGLENLEVIAKVARYLVHHPTTHIFIEGHADERGAAAYNLALGSKRANSVRSLLLQDGVSPDQIHTISYGKERPMALGHSPEAWKQNRRAQFKLYER